MKKLVTRIKALFSTKRQQEIQKIIEKKASLEQRITDLEKANPAILAKLLQLRSCLQNNSKINDKSSLILTSPKDYNAGNTPTYH
jgi:uncharacterized protein YaaN involved in tellurite resistance